MHSERTNGLKILLLTNKVPYPANDGSSIAMASMVDAYLKNQVEVSLLSINTHKHFKSEAEIKKQLPAAVNFYAIEANTNPTLRGALKNLIEGSPFHVSRFWQQDYADKLRELLQDESFDLVQIDGLPMGVYLPELRRYNSAPVVYRAHNLEYEIWQRHAASLRNLAKKAYLRLQIKRLEAFEKQIINDCDAVLPITRADQAKLQALAPAQKFYSAPCGIDLGGRKPLQKNQPRYDLVYLASFDWEPNVHGALWFLKAVWPLLQQKRPGTSFHLAGRHMPAALQKLASSTVKISGEVPDMEEFIAGGKLVVVPLLAGSGMRIKIIENMALAQCQVCTSIAAEGIALEDGKDIVLADKPEAMATAIASLLNEPQRIEHIGRQARQTVERYYDNRRIGAGILSFMRKEVC